MQHLSFPDGSTCPALGLGTWRMGESKRERAAEVAAVRLALEIGYRVIDTAEMYGEGGAEEVVGQALAEAMRAGVVTRDEVFVVSKVYPHNASRQGVRDACDRSRRRMGLDRIDLYLLHWRGAHRLADTVAGFETIIEHGHIARWGVSNFDVDDMQELLGVPGGAACAANQVYYSLGERGAGFDLLPWLQRHSMPLMAYCPLDRGRIAGDAALKKVAERHGATATQVALAWVMQQRGVMAIPKAVREAHLRENFASAALQLSAEDLAAIDRRFPPPRAKTALAMS
ncbi:aldo/keto reductase [Rhizobacter sp. AJA081-3]|uniref:aldo/keto reductase n=1 Tax=Rhizobacter sp. AJA081-3 TaxID=2753607 RepID=UPI001ADF45F5|nr:aldo/keto reductase [Rhizobacter sp. AJA081-3]QTN22500.1 aldo/keto reductase [Rhizobacter sp. AJA081-3]